MIWDTDFGTGADAGENAGEIEDEPTEVEQEFEDDENEYIQKKTKRDKYGRENRNVQEAGNVEVEEDAGDLFQVERLDGGDEFLAVKPWLGAIKPPTGYKNPPLNQNHPPKVDLALEYVHGYRAK